DHPLTRLKAETTLKADKEKDEEEHIASKKQIKPKNESEEPIRDRLLYTSSDIGKYERGESPIPRQRVLLFIYYFRQKGRDIITLAEANELIGYIPSHQGFHQLLEDEIRIIFRDELQEKNVNISHEEVKPEVYKPVREVSDNNAPGGNNQAARTI